MGGAGNLSKTQQNCTRQLKTNHVKKQEVSETSRDEGKNIVEKWILGNIYLFLVYLFSNTFNSSHHIVSNDTMKNTTYPSMTRLSYNADLSHTGHIHVGFLSFICRYKDASKHCRW
jgi:hypothetical protein